MSITPLGGDPMLVAELPDASAAMPAMRSQRPMQQQQVQIHSQPQSQSQHGVFNSGGFHGHGQPAPVHHPQQQQQQQLLQMHQSQGGNATSAPHQNLGSFVSRFARTPSPAPSSGERRGLFLEHRFPLLLFFFFCFFFF